MQPAPALPAAAASATQLMCSLLIVIYTLCDAPLTGVSLSASVTLHYSSVLLLHYVTISSSSSSGSKSRQSLQPRTSLAVATVAVAA
jgi:hypothetical protein